MACVKPLTRNLLTKATAHLADADGDMCRLVSAHGVPPLWTRPAGYATLVRIILEQQVSLASGRAAYERLSKGAGRITAHRIHRFTHDDLLGMGLTRQKARYCLELAHRIVDGDVDLAALDLNDPNGARTQLMSITGIGRWTADIYLITALRHPDIWPYGDLALHHVLREITGSDGAGHELDAVAAGRWRPYRAAAARVLWHHYLQTRRPGRQTSS